MKNKKGQMKELTKDMNQEQKEKYKEELIKKKKDEQVKLKFETQEQAIAYAKQNNIPFDLTMHKKNKLIIKAYADNFLNNV